MKNILVIFGTRPEAIKLAPLILSLRSTGKYNVFACNTEQQKELSNQTLHFFGLKADINLDVMLPNQTLSQLQSRLLNKLTEVFDSHKIDAVIVQGDTMSVFCGALAGFYNRVPVFHVEAGLRSYNLYEPFPEEALRQMTSRITALHFAPTTKAYHALLKEDIAPENICMTGNTVIDALHCLTEPVLKDAEIYLSQQNIHLNDKLVLVTAHRRENHGERLKHILDAVKYLAKNFSDHQFVIPVHPNPNVKQKVIDALQGLTNVILLPPADYPVLVSLMKNAKLVLTDSGGIQEEAPSFGAPVLVMRYETERLEGVEAGFAKLVGADYDTIIREASDVLSQEKALSRKDGTKNPYGDGHACENICLAIEKFWR